MSKNQKQNKFFGGDSSSEESESSEDEQQQTQNQKNAAAGGKKKFYGGNSDDSEDDQRVVKTTTDKRTDILKGVFEKMRNHIKIGDFQALQQDFDLIQAEMEKCIGSVFATDKLQTLPNWVVKNLMELEDTVLEVTNEQKKKMSKPNSQAFTKLRQKLKKYLESTGDEENLFQAQVEAYRKNPPKDVESKKESSDDDSDSDESSSSDASSSDGSDSGKDAKKKKTETKKVAKKDDSSSEEESSSKDSGSDSDSSSGSDSGDDDSGSDSDKSDSGSDSDSEEEVKKGELPKKYAFLALSHEEKTPEQRRYRWVKYENLPEDMKQYIKPKSEKKIRKDKKNRDDGEERKNIDRIGQLVDIVDERDLDYSELPNVEKILTKYKNQQISKKNFDINQQIDVLNIMLKAQESNVTVKIEIYMLLLTIYFQSAKYTSSGYLERKMWTSTCSRINEFVEVLKNHNFTKEAKKTSDEGDLDTFISSSSAQILPAIVNFVDKIDQQLFKAFQTLDHTSIEYLMRLRDECKLIQLCDATMQYLASIKENEKAARVGLIKLEKIYYKNDSIYAKTKEALKNKPQQLKELYFLSEPSEKVVDDLVSQVLAHCDKKLKTKAVLLQVYHHALHNRYYQAKDLVMKGQFSQNISKQAIVTQVLYNRAIVQIAIAAFRLSLFDECNTLLVDVCQSPKIKESLAQGVSNQYKQAEKTLEEEQEERKRFVPPHLHINLEMLDCIYMTTSMFLEIPNLSTNKFVIAKKVINKNFRKLMEQYDQKGIQFNPQNSRDFIVFAARNLYASKWQEAFDYICHIKIFNKLTEFSEGPLKDALKEKCRQTSLKIFLIESQNQYDSFSLPVIQDQFQLPKSQVLKQASKLIAKGDLNARLDGDVIVLNDNATREIGTLPQNDRKEMIHLQNAYLDQIKQMVENNDRCIDLLINQNHYISSTKEKQR